ncbi:Transmembrane domain-containing protein [Spironucleus salmonicida]|uniref:Transmembrane domain-containing protein n=1 Tax=Spironucleus salmonicida TaxID=348837 RepID=V6LXH5_9EUKA|nr:Transmembrane domain-containing protein [Spironucleus salmonicida]|eukprot:EST48421.1 Transmembrane domain-containing protein [Spironucleus salmonicida]
MIFLSFLFEISLCILRGYTRSTCGSFMYTTLQIANQILTTYAVYICRITIQKYFKLKYRHLMSSVCLVLTLISLMDIENSRHTHMRYTSQYSELFGVQNYLYKNLVINKGYKLSNSNWFIGEIIKRDKIRFSIMIILLLAILFNFFKLKKYIIKPTKRQSIVYGIYIVIVSVLYYFDINRNATPGYWPYLRSLLPLGCTNFDTKLPKSNYISQKDPPSLLLISLESFSSHYLETYKKDIPFITSLLSTSIFFTNAYSHTIPTSNSVFSLFSSLTAPTRTTVSVGAHNAIEFPFFIPFFNHTKSAILPFVAEFDKTNQWFQQFDQIFDQMPVEKNKYKWKPDRISKNQVKTTLTAPYLSFWATAEAHYPFLGFDDEAYYQPADNDIGRVLRYLDSQLEDLIQDVKQPILLISDHGSGKDCTDTILCKFGTIASLINFNESYIVDQPVTQNFIVRQMFQMLYGFSYQENNLIQDGFESYILENNVFRKSTARERYNNDCKVANLERNGENVLSWLQVCRFFIYVNYVYIIVIIVDELISQDGMFNLAVVKQRMQIE